MVMRIKKGQDPFPAFTGLFFSLICWNSERRPFDGRVTLPVVIAFHVQDGGDEERANAHQETHNAAEPEPGADTDRV